MSQQNTETEAPPQDALLGKLYAQLNEERLLKDIGTFQLARIRPLDELAEEITASDRSDDVRAVLEESLKESPGSFVSRYVLGNLALHSRDTEGVSHLRALMEEFRDHAKWPVVDHVADRILDADPANRTALRAKVESTERLKGKKELKPYLERLAAIDKKNPDVARKFGLAILEEDKSRALGYLKQAGETYARLKDYRSLEEIWHLMVQNDHGEMAWFERIERILVGNREKAQAAGLYVSLLEPYRTEETWPSVISILKKILDYEPASTRARADLVRAYRAQYASHSLLDDFLKMSELTNNKRPVAPAIASFERNIVFDKENYVYHRTRGVGKIASLDNNEVVIDFSGQTGLKMSIQMAISSLKPLGPDHIWVRFHESAEEMKEIFREDIPLFFETLLKSFDFKMMLPEIKNEICGKYLDAAEWSRWWSRARAVLKKNPRFGFNPKKKDELHLRERPMTLSEELSLKFQALSDWNEKLEQAMETLKDPDTESAAELCGQFYREQAAQKDVLKRIHCYLFLKNVADAAGDEEARSSMSPAEFDQILIQASADEIVAYSAQTPIVEFKREMVHDTIRLRTDYPETLGHILFELPIKVNRHVVSELNRLRNYDTLAKFVDRACARFTEHPEIFLWVARSILTDQWNYEWVRHSKEEIVLLLFRLLKPLARIEKKGTRLKNLAIETLFGTTNITLESVRKGVLPEILGKAEIGAVRRMSAIFREVPYIPEAHKENLLALIQEQHPDFTLDSDFAGDDAEVEPSEVRQPADLLPPDDVILVSEEGLARRRAHLDRLIHVEMPANSREIGEAQERGDLRENAEYKAALERQSQLQAEITRVDAELKKARTIRSHEVPSGYVAIGSRVVLAETDGTATEYRILGPWDADAEQRIISYLSPLGKALIGRKPGDRVSVEAGRTYEIKEAAPAN